MGSTCSPQSEAMARGAAAAPAPPDADPRRRRAGPARRAGRDAPARHRAEDARRDRTRRAGDRAGRMPSGGRRGCATAARRAVATITISPHDQGEAVRLLGIDPETVHSIPNGVDIDHFTPHRPSPDERRAHWLRWLVSEPQGWDEATSHAGQHPLHRGRGDRRILRCRDRRGAPGADVRRPLPGLQTRAAAGSRLRAGTRRGCRCLRRW